MYRDTSSHSLVTDRRIKRIQEYKMKTILCLFSAACCCLVILAVATASPIDSTTSEDNSSTTSLPVLPVGQLANGSKLVITHIVKTLEFEVDLRDDDGDNDTNTESSTPFFETGIEVLNPELLLSVVEHQYKLNNHGPIDGTKASENEDDEEDD